MKLEIRPTFLLFIFYHETRKPPKTQILGGFLKNVLSGSLSTMLNNPLISIYCCPLMK